MGKYSLSFNNCFKTRNWTYIHNITEGHNQIGNINRIDLIIIITSLKVFIIWNKYTYWKRERNITQSEMQKRKEKQNRKEKRILLINNK